MWSSNRFSASNLFASAFQGLVFSKSRFFRVQLFQIPRFSDSRFFLGLIFQGPGFRFSVQVLEVVAIYKLLAKLWNMSKNHLKYPKSFLSETKACFQYLKVIEFIQKLLPDVFYKKVVFKNFEKFTEITPAQSPFFNKVADFRSATLLKVH